MLAFVIPYRNREKELLFFNEHMKNEILNDMKENIDYVIYFIHQKDKRPFNRGAMKNIGFLIIKEKFPETYKSMTIIFNDIDTLPKKKKNYKTTSGIVKHFIGYFHTLGGIVSITGEDFERVNGFPNHWSWGREDVELYESCKKILNIDRSDFYELYDKLITEGEQKYIVSSKTTIRHYSVKEMRERRNEKKNLEKIKNLKYEEEGNVINITNFETDYDAYSDMCWKNFSKNFRGVELKDKYIYEKTFKHEQQANVIKM